MKKNSNIRKNFIWNIVGTTFNSFNSLFFLILVTRINGIDDAGIFSFGFSLACVFYCIGNYSGRVYQVTERDKSIEHSDFVYTKIFSCLIMLTISIIYVLSKGYIWSKVLVILFLVLFKMVEAFSESLYGIIQRKGDLYKVGISMLLKGIFSLLFFFIIDYLTKNVILSSLSLIIVNLLVVVAYDFTIVKKYDYKFKKLDTEKVWKILKHGFSTFLFTFLTLYVINAPKYAIDEFLVDKFQTIFGIIVMPATVMILCSQFLMHPFLLSLTENLNENKLREFINVTIKLSIGVFVIGCLGCVLAYFLGIPVLNLLYGINLEKYLNCLIIIIIGATMYGISYIISNALTTMRKTVSQVVIFLGVSVFSYIISRILVNNNGVFGASLAYFLSMVLLLIFYLINYVLSIKNWRKEHE